METTVTTKHVVTIVQADFLQWLAANAASLPLDTAAIALPTESDGRAFNIVFAVDQPFLDSFLHSVITGLPAIGGYTYEIFVANPNMIARITWTEDQST